MTLALHKPEHDHGQDHGQDHEKTIDELRAELQSLREELSDVHSDKLAFQSLYRDAMDALKSIQRITVSQMV